MLVRKLSDKVDELLSMLSSVTGELPYIQGRQSLQNVQGHRVKRVNEVTPDHFHDCYWQGCRQD